MLMMTTGAAYDHNILSVSQLVHSFLEEINNGEKISSDVSCKPE